MRGFELKGWHTSKKHVIYQQIWTWSIVWHNVIIYWFLYSYSKAGESPGWALGQASDYTLRAHNPLDSRTHDQTFYQNFEAPNQSEPQVFPPLSPSHRPCQWYKCTVSCLLVKVLLKVWLKWQPQPHVGINWMYLKDQNHYLPSLLFCNETLHPESKLEDFILHSQNMQVATSLLLTPCKHLLMI